MTRAILLLLAPIALCACATTAPSSGNRHWTKRDFIRKTFVRYDARQRPVQKLEFWNPRHALCDFLDYQEPYMSIAGPVLRWKLKGNHLEMLDEEEVWLSLTLRSLDSERLVAVDDKGRKVVYRIER